MPDLLAVHDRFTLERRFPHPPARVFAAFATEEGKARWFSGPNEHWELVERAFDFRPGGIEILEGRWHSGKVTRMDLVYRDIVPDRRIVYAYDMTLDGTKISSSLTSVELVAEGPGTRLVMTEHGIYLDGYADNGSRRHGVGVQFDKLVETLAE